MARTTIGSSQVAAGVLGLLLVSSLVMRTSSAAFTATTDNDGNSWQAGTVSLSDDDAGAVMFNVSALRPGDTGTRCIEVTYAGTLTPNGVRLYAENVTDTDSAAADGAVLSDHLDLVIEYDAVTTGTFAGGCGDFTAEGTAFTGTLAALSTTHTNYTNGADLSAAAGDWAPVTSESRVFKITWTLDAAAPDTAQGDTAEADFVWEARS